MLSKIKILTPIAIIVSLIFLSGCFKKTDTGYKVPLEIWGSFDDSDAYGKILEKYRMLNPYIGEIKYRKFDADNYKKDLIDALASGQGPDMFFIHNTWLPSFKDKIEPAPAYLFGEQELRRDFVDVAVSDFLDEGKVCAVPLSVDSLALYYNKDLFNAEGITSPPSTWENMAEDAKRLTRTDQSGNIIQQGAALGTAYNINRSTDILGLIMLQKGARMVNEEKTQATFNDSAVVNNNSVRAGEDALEFYTRFSRSSSPVYSWNSRMHYSLDAFYEGTAAMMLNYSWHYSNIKNKNSKLNFAVAPAVQFKNSRPVNYANYWGLAVAKNKIAPSDSSGREVQPPSNEVRIHEAWQLIRFLTAKDNGSVRLINGKTTLECFAGGKSNCIEDNSKVFPSDIDPAWEYAREQKKPGARRDIVERQKSDPVLGPFAHGNLIAKSWYQSDPEATETVLAQAINSVVNGTATVHDALELAANRVSQFMRK